MSFIWWLDVSGLFVCLLILNIFQSFASISANPYTYMDNTVRFTVEYILFQFSDGPAGMVFNFKGKYPLLVIISLRICFPYL